MSELKLAIHVERISALDDSRLGLGFGLTLSVDWIGDQSGDKPTPTSDLGRSFRLFPWSWAPILEFQLGRRNATTGAWDIVPVLVTRLQQDQISSGTSVLFQQYEAEYTKDSTKLGALNAISTQEVKISSTGDRQWTHLIGELRGAPAPVATSGNLSFLFRCAAIDIKVYDRFAFAPVFPVKLPDFPAIRMPTSVGYVAASESVIFSYQALTLGDYEIRAVSNLALKDPAEKFGGIDLKTLRVTILRSYASDWKKNLVANISKAFSGPEFLHYFLQQKGDQVASKEREEVKTKLVELGVRCLRDTAGLGIESGPDGISVWKVLKPNVSLDLLTVQNAFQNAMSRSGDWRSSLTKVDGASQLSILNGRKVRAEEQISEFDFLQSALSNQENQSQLYAFYLDHWQKVLAQYPGPPPDVIAAITAALPNLKGVSLPKMLRDELAGLYWPTIFQIVEEDPSKLLLRIQSFSRYHVLRRLGVNGLTDPGLPSGWNSWRTVPQDPPIVLDQTIQNLLISAYDEWFQTQAAEYLPNKDAPLRGQRQTPQPIHLQLVPFVKETAETPSLASEKLRAVGGFGALMRQRNSPQKWSVLNLAKLRRYQSGDIEDLPIAAPIRAGYVAGLLECPVAYDNEPLVGGGPLAMPDAIQGLSKPGDRTSMGNDPLFEFVFHPQVKVPGLKFGQQYEFASYAILNSGVLPKELQRSATTPCLPKFEVDDGDLKQWPKLSTDYKRYVPIGGIRTDINQKSLPSVPKSVSPRANDLRLIENGKQQPLILLSPPTWTLPAQSEFELRISLPQTTWSCWDRWVSGLVGRPSPVFPTVPTAADRTSVIQESLKPVFAQDRQCMPTIDDPAVARKFHIEIANVDTGERIERFLKLQNPPQGSTGLNKFSCPPAFVKLSFQSGGSGLRFDPPPIGRASIGVEEGNIYILKISVCVPVECQANQPIPMFGPGVVPTGTKVDEGKTYFLDSPSEFVIEVATSAMPSAADLYRAFAPRMRCFSSENPASGVSAQVLLQPPSTDISQARNFQHLGSASLARQSWRWDGRPVPIPPELIDPAPPNLDQKNLEWIAKVYGEYRDAECDRFEMAIGSPVGDDGKPSRLQTNGVRSLFYSETLTRNGFGSGLRGFDERCLHFRYGIRAHSRYEALGQAKISPIDAYSSVPGEGHWKPLLVANRLSQPLSVPKLKFVLPLTEGHGRSVNLSPGLLAVFDEVWYEEAGLGEGLQVELDLTRDPTEKLPTPTDPGLPESEQKFYVEFGPDVIVTKSTHDNIFKTARLKKESQASVPLEDSTLHNTWAGPVGHYKDADNRSAKFIATSFVIPTPKSDLSDVKLTDARWWFAKLRFRRSALTKGLAAGPNMHTLKLSASAETQRLLSEPTEPYWVQLLPDFSVFDGFEQQISSLIPNLDAATKTLTLENRTTREQVKLQPFSTDPLQNKNGKQFDEFRLYAVLTKRAYDFRGVPNQEVYMTVFSQTAQKEIWRTDESFSVDPKGVYRVRILEVQLPSAEDPTCGGHMPKWPEQPSKIWDALFGVSRVKAGGIDSACDATGRIVRLSEPADSRLDLVSCYPEVPDANK